jgi:dihydrofolate reductase
MKVIAIAAITANGLIGQTADQISWEWTSPEDRALLIRLTKEAGAVVLGARTFDTFKRRRAFPGRRTIIYTKHPETIAATDIETTAEKPADLVKRLQNEGATGLAVIGGTSIYTQFLSSGCVGELYLTVEPILFGTGIPLVTNLQTVKLRLIETGKLNDNTVLLHYAVEK